LKPLKIGVPGIVHLGGREFVPSSSPLDEEGEDS